jgi:LysR family transcriptional regulator, nitrogen assimilation regulatory protein
MPNRPNTLDLAMVRAFVHTCDTGSITRAAPELGYSQPGLSQRLQTLERVLGVRLLVREPGGVHPTEAGAAVLPHARSLLATADTMRQEATRASTPPASPDTTEPAPDDP